MSYKTLLIMILFLFNIYLTTAKELLKKEIYFYPDSDEIKTNSLLDIDELIIFLRDKENYLITLRGYTNSVGNPEEELELSKRRANRIAFHLNNKGIPLSKIVSEGFGSQNLKENKITEKNRRVEIFIYQDKNEVAIEEKFRKFKISVFNKRGDVIYASVLVKYNDKKYGIFQEEHKLNEPRVIDIPIGDKIEIIIDSIGYQEQRIIVTRKDDEEKIYLIKETTQKIDKMIYVEGGTFLMGDTRKTGYKDELPVHKVSVDSFYIGAYEVTQKEWEEVMGYNPSEFKGSNLPVHNITWYEAIEYCNKRSEKEGLRPYYIIFKNKIDPNNKNNKIDKYNWTVEFNIGANGYRLPTEAEYEYAARGGNKSKNYKFSGSSIINDIASGIGRVELERVKLNMGHDQTLFKLYVTEPGKNIPNELNLFDMSNNILEWCWDWYNNNYYKMSENKNPKGAGEGSDRVIRGGLSKDNIDNCRVSARQKAQPFKKYFEKISVYLESFYRNDIRTKVFIGLRVARNVD